MSNIVPKIYNFDPLKPELSETQMKNHYEHYKKYVQKTNLIINSNENLKKLLSITKTKFFLFYAIKYAKNFEIQNSDLNTISQTYFHEIFFEGLSSSDNSSLSLLTNKTNIFGSDRIFNEFYEEYLDKSLNHFASGWIWFVYNKNTDKLEIHDTQDAKYPKGLFDQAILCMDLWEHAYYTDYAYNRNEYVKKIFGLINWNMIYDKIQQIK